MVMREVEILAIQCLCSVFARLKSHSSYDDTVYTNIFILLFYLLLIYSNVKKCRRVNVWSPPETYYFNCIQVAYFTYKAKDDVTFHHVFIFDNSVPNPFKQHYQKAINIGHCRGLSEFQAVFLSDAGE